MAADEAPVLTEKNRAPVDKDPLPRVLPAKGKNHGHQKQKQPTLLEKVSCCYQPMNFLFLAAYMITSFNSIQFDLLSHQTNVYNIVWKYSAYNSCA